MIAAQARSVSEHSVRSIAEHSGVTPTRIGTASTVLQHAPDLVDAVIAGATGLDEAYRIARERKTAADSVEASAPWARGRQVSPGKLPDLADVCPVGAREAGGRRYRLAPTRA